MIVDKLFLKPLKVQPYTNNYIKQRKLDAWKALPNDIKQTMKPYFNIKTNEAALFKGVPNSAEFDIIVSRIRKLEHFYSVVKRYRGPRRKNKHGKISRLGKQMCLKQDGVCFSLYCKYIGD